jgi:microcystin-dependent protein
MATVTGFTAARMLEIENTTVVDGNVVGNNLILQTREGTTIDAGNVRGPQGIQGIPGPSLPSGAITMFGGSVAPTGYLICNGSDVSRTTYADLFAAIGISYGSINGTTFKLPDLRSRFPVGQGSDIWSDSLNERGGSKDLIVVSHNHTGPLHAHTINHGHGAIDSSGQLGSKHHHGVDPPNTGVSGGYGTNGAPSGWATTGDPGIMFGALDGFARSPAGWMDRPLSVDIGPFNSGNDAGGDHYHSTSIGTFSGSSGSEGTGNTSTNGSSGIDANLPPYITVNFIIKI